MLLSYVVVHAFVGIFYCVGEGGNTSFILRGIRNVLIGINVVLAFLKNLLVVDLVNEASDVDRVLECLGTIGGFLEYAVLITR